MKIVVTGSTGILGGHFVECARSRQLDVEQLSCDLRDKDATAAAILNLDFDVVVHLAARVEVSRVASNPYLALSVNAGGTLNLLEAIRRSKKKPWFFYASTSHVYAHSLEPLSETAPVAPRNLYAATKYSGEIIARTYEETNDIRLCIGRIFSTFDENQTGYYLYPAMKARVLAHDGRTPIRVRDANTLRDFSRACDVAGHIMDLTQIRATGIVNIASGTSRRVIDQVREWFGDEAEFEPEPGESSGPIIADITRLRELTNGRP